MIATLFLLTSVMILVITYYQKSFKYWRKKKVPEYDKPSIPLGNLENPFKRTKAFWEFLQDIYKHFREKDFKHGGFYTLTTPVYMPVDPTFIRNILVKDFSYFTNRGVYYDEKNDPLLTFMFGVDGDRWKKMRSNALPIFSTGQMKSMLPILIEYGNLLKEAMDTQRFADQEGAIHIKDLLSRYATDIMTSAAFGIKTDCIFQKESKFRNIGLSLTRGTVYKTLCYTLASNFPKLGTFLGVKVVSKEAEEFLTKVVKDALDYREKNKYTRNDLLQVIIEFQNKAKSESNGDNSDILTLNEITGFCLAYFLAGFETSASLLTFTFLELCQHQDIQEAARKEINTVLGKYNGEITYEALFDMKYLGQILDESLRLHPPVPVLKRKSNKEYKVPDTDVILDKGTHVLISVYGLHHDEDHFPNPEVFDPERFTDENKRHIKPYTYLPFGDGPRMCLGARFAYMESKLALVILLKSYEFTFDKRMTFPLKMDKYNYFFNSVEGGVWLRARRIDEAQERE